MENDMAKRLYLCKHCDKDYQPWNYPDFACPGGFETEEHITDCCEACFYQHYYTKSWGPGKEHIH
jgi:hypothetical protein